MPKIADITGKRFGRWTVIEKTKERDAWGRIIWKCKCDCGNEKGLSSQNLRFGSTKSCGCLKKDAYKLGQSVALAKSLETRNSSNKPYHTNLSTGIKNISYKPEQGMSCYQVSIFRKKRRYCQYFTTLKEAERAKEYVLSRYKKGISNWNEKL